MALEPVTVSAESGPSAELADMTRRFWVAVALSIPILVLEMGAELVPAIDNAVPAKLSVWLQLALATPVVLWAGRPFFTRGWTSVRTRKLNMFTLIAMGTGVAWLFSVVATVAPGLFPDSFQTMDGTVAVYFEAAAVITTLVLLGQVLELRAREQTSGAIRALLDLTPKMAHRLGADGAEQDVTLDLVQLGDLLRIRPGEKVPVDGVVEEGRSSLDEALITGESLPVDKSVGEQVIGGTLNQSGTLVIRADAVGRDTMLARIVQMGRRGATLARPHPADGRPGLGVVRARRDRRRRPGVPGLGDRGTRAAFGSRAGRRGLGADHRLPLRAGTRYADVDHGRCGTRSPDRRADQERRSVGAYGEG
jgi:Cu+-exporting ATPase